MESFKIQNTEFRPKDIDMIAISKSKWLGNGTTYALSVYQNRRVIDFMSTENCFRITNKIERLNNFFQRNGAGYFIFMNEKYLINVNNVQAINQEIDIRNNYIIKLRFKTGKHINLYHGESEIEAKEKYDEYFSKANKILNKQAYELTN